jgi:hypothetical protein
MSVSVHAGSLASHKAKHRVELILSRDGIPLVINIIDKKTNLPILVSHPNGSDDHLKHAHRVKRMSIKQYSIWMRSYIKRTEKKVKNKKSVMATAQPPKTGLGLGFSETLGYVGAQSVCYNATTTFNNPQDRLSFSSQESGNSVTSATNITASVDLSFGLFKATNDFSYSSNYKSTANSGHILYTAGSVYTANSVLDSLSDYGKQAFQAGAFEDQCGTDFVSSMQVGMLIAGDLRWSTSTTDANQNIADKLKASYTFVDLSAGVNVANSMTESNSEFIFTLQVQGGGASISNMVTQAYVNSLDLRNQCLAKKDTAACSAFTAALEKASADALGAFKTKLESGDFADLNFLQPFPYGVMGITELTSLKHIPVSKILSGSVVPAPYLSSYAPALKKGNTLLNQISTLRNRADFVYAKLYNKDTRTDLFNPRPMRDLANDYISPVSADFSKIRNHLIQTMEDCMQSDSTNVDTNCQNLNSEVGKGAVTDIFSYIQTNGLSINPSTLFNTIALQYTGLFTKAGTSIPLDFIYTTSIGSGWYVPIPSNESRFLRSPDSTAGLYGFADEKYTVDGGAISSTPWAFVIPYIGQGSFMGAPVIDNYFEYITPNMFGFLRDGWMNLSTWTVNVGDQISMVVAGSCKVNSFNSPCNFYLNNFSSYSPGYAVNISAIKDMFMP